MINPGCMLVDEQENKERKLSKAEIERTERFAKLSSELEEQGFKKQNLTVSAAAANVAGLVLGFLLALPVIAVYYFMGKWNGYEPSIAALFISIPAFILGIVVHELLHGSGWILFTKGKFKSIAFGVVWEALMPYCTCKEALKKGQYIFGLLLPCIVLGYIPGIISCINGSGVLLGYSVLMIVSAGGDLMVMLLILKSKLKGDVLFVDHPTEIGLAAFVRENN